uniref:Uncharacterized protein n=1 Tax=Culex tarsalis TaxID=7177 RepID=A0A1Q3F5X1_CULTA
MVTTQLEGSDFDDESDFEDSEEDWQPAKGEQKGKKLKASPAGRAGKKSSPPAGKNGAGRKRGSGGGRKPSATSRKSKKKAPSSEEEQEVEEPEVSEHEEEDLGEPEQEPVPTPAKRVRQTPKKAEQDGGQTSVKPVLILKLDPTTSSKPAVTKPVPLQRKVANPVKSYPDKFGYLSLHIFKGDLKDGIVNNPSVCLWRRDGSSLLQKYLRDKTVNSDLPQFNSSMVYSCWEDKRANEYIEVKVRCIEQSRQVRVQLTNVDELEVQSRAEYESYVAEHGVPEQRTAGNAGNSQEGTDNDDDEEFEDNEGEEGEESEEAEEE